MTTGYIDDSGKALLIADLKERVHERHVLNDFQPRTRHGDSECGFICSPH